MARPRRPPLHELPRLLARLRSARRRARPRHRRRPRRARRRRPRPRAARAARRGPEPRPRGPPLPRRPPGRRLVPRGPRLHLRRLHLPLGRLDRDLLVRPLPARPRAGAPRDRPAGHRRHRRLGPPLRPRRLPGRRRPDDAPHRRPRARLGPPPGARAGPTPFFLVGETFTGATGFDSIAANLGPHGLDGQFEFPTLWALRDFVARGSGDAQALEDALAASEARWAGSGSVMSPFVGNHDMSRFLTAAAGDDPDHVWTAPPPQPDDEVPYRKLLAAQALVLGLPGAPVLYYGDEYGLAGGNDPDNRRAWPAAPTALQAWTRERIARLGRTRRCSDALRLGVREPLLADGPVYAMRRRWGGAEAVVVLNASPDDRTVALDLPGTWWDAVEDEPGLDPATLLLPAWSARTLLPDADPCSRRIRP
ncbi:MAG: alpha-amylase family glycosyl hydrolase [Myxococcota bacterium]